MIKEKLKYFYGNTYTNLLSGLIFLLLLTSLVDDQFLIGNILISVGFFTNILLALKTLSLPKKISCYLQILAIASLCFSLINRIFNIHLAGNFFVVVNYIVYVLFIGMSIVIISKHIFNSDKVTGDTLKGGISVYIMIGILWYLFYAIILIIDSHAFSIKTENLTSYHLVYFSYTTLTTLGYGDISPVNEFAMALTNLEGIIGQMYPAIFISRLVSLYTKE